MSVNCLGYRAKARLQRTWLSVSRVCDPVKLHCSGRTVFLLKRVVTLTVCVPSGRCHGVTGHGELANTSAAVTALSYAVTTPSQRCNGINSDPKLPRIAVAVHAGAREGIIAGKSGGIISRYAIHC